MSLTTEFQELAKELISKDGTEIIVQSNSSDDEDATSKSKGIITQVTTDDLADSFITYSDKVVYTYGLKNEPKEGDSITFKRANNRYTIIRITKANLLDMDKTNIYYRFIVRP